MQITVEGRSGSWRADLKGRPGSALVGIGKTKHMAVAHLLFMVVKSPNDCARAAGDIDLEIILINEDGTEKKIPHRFPPGYLRR